MLKFQKAFHQQYVIAGANKLVIFYSILSIMQMDLSSMSSGKPKR
jgi:hypothetical protein